MNEKLKIYSQVSQFRAKHIAPVDVAGCQAHLCNDEEKRKYIILISLILRSRTEDLTVFPVVEKMSLDINKIDAMTEDEILEQIKTINFSASKAKYIKQTTNIIKNNYNGKIPMNAKELANLPGIGPKSVELFLSTVSKDSKSLSVDTHLDRIFKRWRWVSQDNKTPEKTMNEMKKWFPEEYRPDVHQIVAGFGQIICSAKPHCNICPVKEICPSFDSNTKIIDIEDLGRRLKEASTHTDAMWVIPDQNGKPNNIETTWFK